ncbi:hypothetical protein FD755_025011, partial [Muntiacus reevesi]
ADLSSLARDRIQAMAILSFSFIWDLFLCWSHFGCSSFLLLLSVPLWMRWTGPETKAFWFTIPAVGQGSPRQATMYGQYPFNPPLLVRNLPNIWETFYDEILPYDTGTHLPDQAKSFSRVQLFVTPWTGAHQASLDQVSVRKWWPAGGLTPMNTLQNYHCRCLCPHSEPKLIQNSFSQDPFKYSYPPLVDDDFQTPLCENGPIASEDEASSKEDIESDGKDTLETISNEEQTILPKKGNIMEPISKADENEKVDSKMKTFKKPLSVFKGPLLHISPAEELYFGSTDSGEKKALIVLTNVTKNIVAFKID